MKCYKAVQIQIMDQECASLSDSISDLGCYYSLIKKEPKFIDVALFADSNNCVKISLSDPESVVSMIIKNLTDKSVVGRLRLQVKEILDYEQDYIQWYEFQNENQTHIKVQLKFMLLQHDVASPSPMKSSLNNSQQYTLSSNSQEQSQNSTEQKQMINSHYLTMGQQHDLPIVSQFPTSPTFKRMVEVGTQVECENQDLFTLKLDNEQLADQYRQSQNALHQYQQKLHEYDQQNQLQMDDIQKMKQQIQHYQKEIMVLKNEQSKSQPLDNALIDQIKKLKNTIKQLEEQNQSTTCETLNKQIITLQEKLQRNDSILKLTDEQNKYILNLNQKLVQREQELNNIIAEQQITIEQFESVIQQKKLEYEKLKLSLKKESLQNSILIRIQETQLLSYNRIVGPLDEYLDQIKN